MKRGDVVTVALQGDQGKPRPAVIVQADSFIDLHSVTILPITSTLAGAPIVRIRDQPSVQNGLRKLSEIMADKPQTPLRTRIGSVLGRLDETTLKQVDRALAVFLGIA